MYTFNDSLNMNGNTQKKSNSLYGGGKVGKLIKDKCNYVQWKLIMQMKDDVLSVVFLMSIGLFVFAFICPCYLQLAVLL